MPLNPAENHACGEGAQRIRQDLNFAFAVRGGFMQGEQSAPAREFSVTHRSILRIAVPMTLAFLTTPLLGLTDTAVAGRLDKSAAIGGLAVASILFDLVFAGLNFLRSATTGLVAQANGRGDAVEEVAVFCRSFLIAIGAGVAVLVISPLLLDAGLALMQTTEAVSAAASTYFLVRVFSAPAALANYAVLGYVLGRGEGGTGLLLQIIINGTNIVLSILLGLTFGYGLTGIALATVIAEVFGLLCGLLIVWMRMDKSARPDRAHILSRPEILRLMRLNGDIMIRSVALIISFGWFTRLGNGFGETVLAANAILMNIFLVAGYYLDGFATAAEQIAGRAIGARYKPAFLRAVKLTSLWGFALAGATTLFFLVFGTGLINLMTTLEPVRQEASAHLTAAAFTALAGVLAFQMDGVFIGATWSRDMRNMMVLSLALFIALSLILTDLAGNTGLWIAFNIFLGLRGLTLLAILPARIRAAF